MYKNVILYITVVFFLVFFACKQRAEEKTRILASPSSDTNLVFDIKSIPTVSLSNKVFASVPFISRYTGEGDWNGTLAMNINYQPIVLLRNQLEKLPYKWGPLKFFKGWDPKGEAHITTITPVEYQNCMWSEKRGLNFIHMNEINQIAQKLKIQNSDLVIVGIGSGQKNNFKGREGMQDQTFFIIVESNNLLKIRKEIYQIYKDNGGDEQCWKPEHFYPHITVGFTHRDIHEPDVFKNKVHSLDNRVLLTFSR